MRCRVEYGGAHGPEPHWEKVKLGVMREAVEAKFRQHDEDGGDGSGRNELGRILMAVRAALRAEADR